MFTVERYDYVANLKGQFPTARLDTIRKNFVGKNRNAWNMCIACSIVLSVADSHELQIGQTQRKTFAYGCRSRRI